MRRCDLCHKEEEESNRVTEVPDSPDREFECLVRKYRPLLESMVFRDVRVIQDREDVLQDTLLAAYLGYGTARPKDFRKWLLGILRNKIKDYYRNQARGRRRRDLLERMTAKDTSTTPSPNEAIEEREVSDAVLADIAALGATYQQVVYLRVIRQLSSAEIAKQLGIKEGAVRVRLMRGLAKLAERLRRRGLVP